MGTEMRPVRCGNGRPTPYLRRHLPGIRLRGRRPFAIDLGAGNLRNTVFARSLGWRVLPIDAAGDHGSVAVDLGRDSLPCDDGSVDLFLCNYILCFLTPEQRIQLISEINRTARMGAHAIVEMYPAKKGFPYLTTELEINFLVLGWDTVCFSKNRFITRKEAGCATDGCQKKRMAGGKWEDQWR